MNKKQAERTRWALTLKPGKGELLATQLLQAAGLQVYRQYSIAEYFVDIALPDQRIAVEIDAPGKMRRGRFRKRQEARERVIRQHGWKLVRVLSNAVESTVEAVLRESWAPLRLPDPPKPIARKPDTRPNVIRRTPKSVEVIYLKGTK